MGELAITTDNGAVMKVERFFSSSSAIKKEKRGNTKGLVILCKVTTGTLTIGSKINLHLPEDILKDRVVRIEQNKIPLRNAGPGQEIGICLEKETEKKIRELLNQPTSR